MKIEKIEALVQSSYLYQTFDGRSFGASKAKSFEIIFFSLKWKPYLEHCNFIYNFKV